jgi:hypothetical protein
LKRTIDLSRSFGPLTIDINGKTYPIVNQDGSPAKAEDVRGQNILLSPCDDGVHYVIDRRSRKERRKAHAEFRKKRH